MKVATFAAAGGSAALTALLAFAIIRAVGYSGTSLAFVAAAIVGTNVGVIVHHRSGGPKLTTKVKLELGAVLASSALLAGGALQALFASFPYPEITFPMAMVGSFVFPWIIAESTWKALVQAKAAAEAKKTPQAKPKKRA